MLIGFAGYARSGKDAAGGILVREFGFDRLSFADGVRDLARRVGWDGKKDYHGRQLLQRLGQGVRDVVDTDAWVMAVTLRYHPGRPTVITDVRYPNEAEWVESVGGLVVRVVRPDVGPVNDHPSEVALDGWRFDHHLNNAGTITDLRREVAALLGRLNHDPQTVCH